MPSSSSVFAQRARDALCGAACVAACLYLHGKSGLHAVLFAGVGATIHGFVIEVFANIGLLFLERHVSDLLTDSIPDFQEASLKGWNYQFSKL